jgi:hypothetical protein
MSSASAILDLRIITTGSRAGQWGDDTNENMRILDRMAGGAHQLAVTGSATTLVASAYTLGSWHGLVQRVQGSITGTHTLTVPDAERLWVIADETSGAGVLQVGVGSGSTMTMPKSAKALAYVRGSNGIEPILVIGSAGAALAQQATIGSARTVLGAGSAGGLVFQAEAAGSARTLLGAGSAGGLVFQAEGAGSARTVLGAGSAGSLVFQAESAGSALTILGVGSAGSLTMSTNRILGRTTALTGAVEELTVGSGLTLGSGALIATVVLGANNWTGTQNLQDNEVQRPLLTDTAYETSALGSGSSFTMNHETANCFTATSTAAGSWTFSNPPGAPNVGFLVLQLTNGGAFAQTWPLSVSWDGGAAPTLQTSGVDILGFITTNAGTNWRGFRIWRQA